MNPGRMSLLVLLSAAMPLAAHMECASATGAPTRYEPAGEAAGVVGLVPSESPAQAERFIDSAACDLQQAALQSDFASNERVLSLLQAAHDDLARAMGPLWRKRWSQVSPLLARIDRTIERAAAPRAPAVWSGPESFGPHPPSLADLASLAGQGWSLQRRSASLQPPAASGNPPAAPAASCSYRSRFADHPIAPLAAARPRID